MKVAKLLLAYLIQTKLMVQAGWAEKIYMHMQYTTHHAMVTVATSSQNSLGDIRNKQAKVKFTFKCSHTGVSNPPKKNNRGT